MREIKSSDAELRLPQILDEVERGETVVITRHGRGSRGRVARIVPEQQRRQDEIEKAIDAIRALRARTGRITTEELLSSRHEGHRY